MADIDVKKKRGRATKTSQIWGVVLAVIGLILAIWLLVALID